MRLPERQREALELRGERRSYEEIAAIMETSRGSVAQLISRGRINLYDELRGTVLASIAPPSPDCERALPLIAARDDDQLDGSADDVAWLDDHLAGCDRCRLGEEQMREADASYRSLLPIAAAVESPPGVSPAPKQSPSNAPSAPPSVSSRIRLPRGRAAVAGALAAFLLLAGLAAAFVKDDGSQAPATPAADAASGPGVKSEPGAKPVKAGGEGSAAKKTKAQTRAAETNGSGATAAGATPMPVTLPSQATTGGDAPSRSPSRPTRPSGTAGVEPTKQTSAPKSVSKPEPAPTATPTSQSASGPTPTPEASLPVEEPSDAPGRSGEAPGKPSGHPPH